MVSPLAVDLLVLLTYMQEWSFICTAWVYVCMKGLQPAIRLSSLSRGDKDWLGDSL